MIKPNMPNIVERYNKIFVVLSVALNLFIAFQFLKAWYAPDPDQTSHIATLAVLMGFEFVMVHSGVLMSAFSVKISLLIFFPLYGLFVWSFALLIDDWHVVVGLYLLVVFNRMRFAFSNVSVALKVKNILMSFFAAMVYLLVLLFVFIVSDYIPGLGLTDDFLRDISYSQTIKSDGLLLDEPQVALCMGVLYYLFLALMEFGFRNVKVSSPEKFLPQKMF